MDDQLARKIVREDLATVRPLITLSRDGLVLIALAWNVEGPPAYDTAMTATAHGGLELHELSDGAVPTVEAITATKPVVFFAGDTIVGGKQNRVINVSVWLAAAKATPIPVSCLEAARWNAGYRFETGRKLDYAFRASVNAQVYERTRAERAGVDRGPGSDRASQCPSYAADQGALWNEIAARQARASVHSPTAALHDVYEREAVELASFVRAFPCPTGATGVAVGIGGHLVALELFDSAATLAEQWQRLVEGAASAYIDHRRAATTGLQPVPRHRYPDEGALERLLDRAAAAIDAAVVGPSVGEGLDLRLRGERVHGAALIVADHPVHLELFRVETN
jgi:hypothetical protein